MNNDIKAKFQELKSVADASDMTNFLRLYKPVMTLLIEQSAYKVALNQLEYSINEIDMPLKERNLLNEKLRYVESFVSSHPHNTGENLIPYNTETSSSVNVINSSIDYIMQATTVTDVGWRNHLICRALLYTINACLGSYNARHFPDVTFDVIEKSEEFLSYRRKILKQVLNSIESHLPIG